MKTSNCMRTAVVALALMAPQLAGCGESETKKREIEQAASIARIDDFLRANAVRLAGDEKARQILSALTAMCASHRHSDDCRVYKRNIDKIEDLAALQSRARWVAQLVGPEAVAPLLPKANGEEHAELAAQLATLVSQSSVER